MSWGNQWCPMMFGWTPHFGFLRKAQRSLLRVPQFLNFPAFTSPSQSDLQSSSLGSTAQRWPWPWRNLYIYPIGSMYGIYANIWGILMVNVTIYSIHGSYGYWHGLLSPKLPWKIGKPIKSMDLWLEGLPKIFRSFFTNGDRLRGSFEQDSKKGYKCVRAKIRVLTKQMQAWTDNTWDLPFPKGKGRAV